MEEEVSQRGWKGLAGGGSHRGAGGRQERGPGAAGSPSLWEGCPEPLVQEVAQAGPGSP